MTRIIIAGSRKFNNYEKLKNCVDKICASITDEIEIVSGCCAGADLLGETYGVNHGYKCKLFPAEWSTYGKAAGPIRNRQMAEYAAKADRGILIAFPIGESRGTRNMISVAKEYGLEVYIYE